MPIFNLTCKNCNFNQKRLLDKFLIMLCPQCKQENLQRNPNFSMQVKEVLDNGFMPKKIERLRDTETLIKERKEKNLKDRNK